MSNELEDYFDRIRVFIQKERLEAATFFNLSRVDRLNDILESLQTLREEALRYV